MSSYAQSSTRWPSTVGMFAICYAPHANGEGAMPPAAPHTVYFYGPRQVSARAGLVGRFERTDGRAHGAAVYRRRGAMASFLFFTGECWAIGGAAGMAHGGDAHHCLRMRAEASSPTAQLEQRWDLRGEDGAFQPCEGCSLVAGGLFDAVEVAGPPDMFASAVDSFLGAYAAMWGVWRCGRPVYKLKPASATVALLDGQAWVRRTAAGWSGSGGRGG